MKKLAALTIFGLFLTLRQTAFAVTIQFDYGFDTNGFFDDPSRRNLLETAGNDLGMRLNDQLSAINPGGSNSFGAVFFRPDTNARTTTDNLHVPANTLVVYAGGAPLNGDSLAIGGPGGFSAGGTPSFLRNVDSRGQSQSTSGPNATDFAPWGGSLTFDNDSDWYFDDDPTSREFFDSNDFFSVALHELGHLLGIGTADSWDNQVSGNQFTGENSVRINGGNVPLEPGDNSHWLDGIAGLVDGLPQEAALDPSLFIGDRKFFTDLELAALKDVGWEIQAIPLPSAVVLFGSGFLFLLGATRKNSAR